MTGRKGEKGEPRDRGTRVRYSQCVHGKGYNSLFHTVLKVPALRFVEIIFSLN